MRRAGRHRGPTKPTLMGTAPHPHHRLLWTIVAVWALWTVGAVVATVLDAVR